MKTKFRKQRKGAVLMTVVVVSVMMAVIIAAAISLVAHTNTRTNTEYRRKQAYYVAASCVRAFVSETANFTQDATHDDVFIMDAIKKLRNISAKGEEIEVKINKLGVGSIDPIANSQPRWSNAKCTLQVVQNGDENNLKVISKGTYLGQEKVVVAYLSVTPLRMHTYNPKALEIIGTTGGNTGKTYVNIDVYGSTGATDKESHNQNTLYQLQYNMPQLWGDTDINGSLVVQQPMSFRNNPYYCPGVDDTHGCVLNVSRSLITTADSPNLGNPDVTKPGSADPNSAFDYNYLNVGEAFVLSATNSKIGNSDDYQVDTYTSFFYNGPLANIDDKAPGLKAAIAASNPDPSKYWTDVGAGASGAGSTFYGNIYTYPNGGFFNGDMVFSNKVNINGYIYCSGDIFMTDIPGDGAQVWKNLGNVKGIYLTSGHGIYHCDRNVDGFGNTVKSNPLCTVGTNGTTTVLDGTTIPVIYDDNWKNTPRAKRPDFPTLTEDPYYYYPEHMMCCEGVSSTVSTIRSTIYDIYNGGTELDTTKIKRYNDPSFQNIKEDYFDGLPEDVANSRRISYEQNGYPDDAIKTVFKHGSVEYKPDFVINDHFYIDTMDKKKIVINMDDPASPKNLVVVLKNNGVMTSNCEILVKNSTDPESPDAKFVYFVTDSGFGTTEDNYTQTNDYHGYDHSTFNANPKFIFGGTGSTGCLQVVMDFDTFCESSVKPGVTLGNSLNPTQNTSDELHSGYLMKPNNIIFLGTEGCEFHVGSNLLLHASVYMPMGTFICYNKGSETLKFDPYHHNNAHCGTSILGNLCTHEYIVNQSNHNTVVYNRVSPMSMLAYAKGLGEEHATESFQLINYAAY